MSFASDTGYLPSTVSDLMNLVRIGVNEQFSTNYDAETFLGTNFYKYFYALIQLLQEQEVKTSEIVLKLQQYFDVTNEMITRPNTTNPGIFDYFKAAGYLISIKAPEVDDAGKLFVAVDLDDSEPTYAASKLDVCTKLSECVVAGVITQGTEVEAITMSNGQSFDFKFNLPTEVPILLRLTLTTSSNNQFTVLSPTQVRQLLFNNINARYRLGLNFEPQRYFSVVDAPWTSQVKLEYSLDDGSTWEDEVYESEYDEVLTFEIGDIEIVEE